MPDRDRNEDTGQYDRTYSDDLFVQAIEAEGDLPTTREVADRVGCDRDTARRRLSELAGEGTVSKRQFGRSLAWSVVDE